ncbi:MAG: L-seryl-tRNA(Sec) selenium transferase [Gemmatimonadetes bacterium]|nr:L-seryl-tRNA(Sec) selenium transferase [Gemmatimonadota bacterium]
MSDLRRRIPSVDGLLAAPPLEALQRRFGRERTLHHLRAAVARFRETAADPEGGPDHDPSDPDAWARLVESRLVAEERGSLRRVINATGVVLHTNLGRAPLAPAAREAMDRAARGYTNLEYDLEEGRRGSRYDHCSALVRRLTGAEDALVVNNNAAALLLAVNTLARERPVLVSRGELVEIGGGFRIPEILERSGARMVEVGSTNRTRLEDYRAAAEGEDVALVLKVHRSNFRIEGFTEEASLEDLAGLARDLGVPLLHDLGSGLFLDPAALGLPPEPRAAESLAAGADLVAVSGDKLLGGPQAGILAGRAGWVDRMRSNPLCRALRVDKGTLAALEATLRLHLEPERVREEVPALRMLSLDPGALLERAHVLQAGLEAAGVRGDLRVAEGRAVVGGGTYPGVHLPSWTLRVRPGEGGAGTLAARLREGEPPVVARIEEGDVVLDLRTVDPQEDGTLARRLLEATAIDAGPPAGRER